MEILEKMAWKKSQKLSMMDDLKAKNINANMSAYKADLEVIKRKTRLK